MFKEIPGTDGFYSVDESGNVKSNDRVVFNKGSQRYTKLKGKVLKPCVNNKGYSYVDLRLNNKTERYLVHRLVALTFIPNPNNFPYINHIDCNPLNNCVDNLEWCDQSQNIQHAYASNNKRITNEMLQAFHSPKTYLWRAITAISVEDGSVVGEYVSVAEAARYVIENFYPNGKPSVVQSNISTANGRSKTSYGFIWKYKEAK